MLPHIVRRSTQRQQSHGHSVAATPFVFVTYADALRRLMAFCYAAAPLLSDAIPRTAFTRKARALYAAARAQKPAAKDKE
jgi:hypothetical protein